MKYNSIMIDEIAISLDGKSKNKKYREEKIE